MNIPLLAVRVGFAAALVLGLRHRDACLGGSHRPEPRPPETVTTPDAGAPK